MRHLILSLLLILLVLVACPLAAQTSPPPAPANTYDLTWDVRIPMRDGIRLHASLYRPHGLTGPAPVVFNMTPYTSDGFHGEAVYFAQRGMCSLAGVPNLIVWLALDVPDADLMARVEMIGPDGAAILIGEDWVRARYRASLGKRPACRSTIGSSCRSSIGSFQQAAACA